MAPCPVMAPSASRTSRCSNRAWAPSNSDSGAARTAAKHVRGTATSLRSAAGGSRLPGTLCWISTGTLSAKFTSQVDRERPK